MEGFGEGFGRVLGTQNPRFSHFLRHFFDVKFWLQFGGAKNRKKCPKRGAGGFIRAGLAVRAALGGRIIGWGEAYLSLNFKPDIKIGL